MSNILIENLKKKTNNILRPLLKIISKTSIHPTTLTFFSFLTGILAIISLKQKPYFIFFAAASLLFDILDGHLARFLHADSELGKWLDYGADRSIEFLLILFSPANEILIAVTLSLFAIHQTIFLTKIKTAFFARSLMILFFAFGFFVKGLYAASGIYISGILWQVYKIIFSKKHI